MGEVAGTIRDTQGNAIPGAVVTARDARPAVGFDGGAVVENTRIFTADGSGFVAMPACTRT